MNQGPLCGWQLDFRQYDKDVKDDFADLNQDWVVYCLLSLMMFVLCMTNIVYVPEIALHIDAQEERCIHYATTSMTPHPYCVSVGVHPKPRFGLCQFHVGQFSV